MRALVLSGGGALGAYEVGVLRRLTEQGRSWDVIAGVSVGAINAALMAQFKPSEQARGAVVLEDFWSAIRGNNDIYKSQLMGPAALLWSRSVYDTGPLLDLIRTRLDLSAIQASGVRLIVGATSLDTGEYRAVESTSPRFDLWILASATFPLAFPPVEIDGQLWVDGGIRNVTPIADVAGIEGVTEIDVVMTGPASADHRRVSRDRLRTGLAVGARCAEIMANEIFVTDLDLIGALSASNPAPAVKVYAPEAPLGFEPLAFLPGPISSMIGSGYRGK